VKATYAALDIKAPQAEEIGQNSLLKWAVGKYEKMKFLNRVPEELV
jgi:hypothetical protein